MASDQELVKRTIQGMGRLFDEFGSKIIKTRSMH